MTRSSSMVRRPILGAFTPRPRPVSAGSGPVPFSMPLGLTLGRPFTPLSVATSARSSAIACRSAAFSASNRSARASSSPRDRPERGIFADADMPRTSRPQGTQVQPRKPTAARGFAPRTHGAKRHVFRSHYNRFRCGSCRAEMCLHPRRSKYGPNLRAYIVYLIIEMRLSNEKISEHLLAIFEIKIDKTMINTIKSEAAKEYLPV